MRTLTFDELPAALEAQRAALGLGAFSGYLDRRAVRAYRRRGLELSDYVGLFAVDGGRLLGQVVVLRLPYRARDGAETVAGIASVTTAPHARRRGVARGLLEEAHRREREAGARYALLWTSPSWYAHDLYESLGYRDVFVPPLALRASAGTRSLPRGESLRGANAGALEELEELHRTFSRDRTGFASRPAGFLRVEREAGRDLEGLLVLRRRGRAVGYAVAARRSNHLACGELVAGPRDVPALLRALERVAPAGVLALGNTPVLDHAAELTRRGYAVRREAEWRSLMACPLAGAPSARTLRRELTTDDRAFLCMSLDRF